MGQCFTDSNAILAKSIRVVKVEADADSAPIGRPNGVWVGWRVSEALEAFVTSPVSGSMASKMVAVTVWG
jgi:hypothetical protein